MANIRATMRRQGRRAAGTVMLAVCVAAGSLPLAAAEVLDRVLAVVSGTVIMLSDARIAAAFDAVDTTGAPDPVAVTLRWLVDRQLVLDEVSRYDTSAVEPARVAEGLARVRAKFPSDAAFAQALDRLGLDMSTARRWVEGTIRMRDYLSRRFDTMFPPSDDELLEYYTRNKARFVRGGVERSFDDAREDVREVLQQERQRQAVDTWLTRLRRRANVNELYVPVR
jgi:hypothetical protein